MILVLAIVEAPIGFVVGVCLCFGFLAWKQRRARDRADAQTQSLLTQARRDAASLTQQAQLAANQEALKLREQIEQSFVERRKEAAEMERRQAEREALLNSQLARILETEKELKQQRDSLDRKATALENAQQELIELTREGRAGLERLAQISHAEAREAFLKEIEQETLKDASNLSRQILDDAKAHAEEKARKVIAAAIQRYAGEHTFEHTTATIALADNDIKGRIIGREGRNIRAFENATGVTVLIDDAPGAVILSAFDPVRREVAREAMLQLIQDGRIHPQRIEEVVGQVTRDMEEVVQRRGEEALAQVGLPPAHPEVVKLLGKLHFRNSYAQNLLCHSVEVAHLMGLMASELGLDVTAAKRAGLLHDIGKAVSHEVAGPHAVVGAELIQRHGEPEAVVNAVASHHNDVPPIGPLGILVSAADAISASRPGARSESMTTYLKRMEDLEKIGLAFPGVDKCFAVQAGRELRVFVQPEQVTDERAFGLARSIASKIEADLQYPGQIRITVIRETRCVEVAK